MKNDYEMFSVAGNRACASLVKKVVKKIESKTRVTEEDIYAMVTEGIKKISTKHPEITDTEPEYHISKEINDCLKDMKYSFTISRYNF